MNIKRLSLSCGAVFLVVFAYDFVLHNIILKTDYVVTGYLWRPPEDMPKYFGSLLFGQLLLSIAFCAIYATGPQMDHRPPHPNRARRRGVGRSLSPCAGSHA